MSLLIYELMLTTLGSERAPAYEIVSKQIVAASNPSAARKLASWEAIDEGPDTWLDVTLSNCRVIGEARSFVPEAVLCVDSNAS